jgi:drug/metabolite transporter (DMT)-like permease
METDAATIIPDSSPAAPVQAQARPGGRALPSLAAARWPGFLAVILASSSWGVQGILVKYAFAGGANVVTLLALRAAIGSLFIWSLLPLVGRRMERSGPPLAPRRRLGFVGLGLLTVFNSLTYFLALARMPVSLAVLCLYLYPALTVLWSALFFGEHLNRGRAIALVLALGGAALTLNPAALLASGAAISLLGVAFALISAFGNSWYGPVAVRVGRGYHGYTVARHALPATAACFLLYVVASGDFARNMATRSWVICGIVGVLTGASVLLYLIGIARIGPSSAAITTVAEPVTVITLSAIVLAEPMTLFKALGGASIVASIVLLARARTGRIEKR